MHSGCRLKAKLDLNVTTPERLDCISLNNKAIFSFFCFSASESLALNLYLLLFASWLSFTRRFVTVVSAVPSPTSALAFPIKPAASDIAPAYLFIHSSPLTSIYCFFRTSNLANCVLFISAEIKAVKVPLTLFPAIAPPRYVPPSFIQSCSSKIGGLLAVSGTGTGAFAFGNMHVPLVEFDVTLLIGIFDECLFNQLDICVVVYVLIPKLANTGCVV